MLCTMANPVDEQQLINDLIAGDDNAFRTVVRACQPSMLYVARAIVGNDRAADVVQDAWIKAIQALPKFERRSSLKTWILHIVGNTAKSLRRKESRVVASGDAQDMENAGNRFAADGHWSEPPRLWHADTPERILGSEQLRDHLLKAIEALPDTQRAVLELRDIDGLELAEICNMLDLSESNCRVLLHRARTRLWEHIEKQQSR